jgi:UDP-N-acetylglucosamine 3-dehydrogenase
MKKRILLIGAGRFGENHLRVLRLLEKEKKLIFIGVVLRNKKSREAIHKKYGVTVFRKLTPDILKKVDAVDIVTPASTHHEIVEKCLPYVHVFVEKPLSITVSEGKKLLTLARRYKKILAVGHIFRFNDAVKKLKKIIQPQRKDLYYIEGKYTGGSGEPARDCGVITSDLHLFDVLDYILDKPPSTIYCRSWTRTKGYKFEDQASIILDYPGNIHAYLKLGWVKAKKVRSIAFYFSKKEIHADLLAQTIIIKEYLKKKITLRCFRKSPLRLELEGFIASLKGRKGEYIGGDVANRITNIIERARVNA